MQTAYLHRTCTYMVISELSVCMHINYVHVYMKPTIYNIINHIMMGVVIATLTGFLYLANTGLVRKINTL